MGCAGIKVGENTGKHDDYAGAQSEFCAYIFQTNKNRNSVESHIDQSIGNFHSHKFLKNSLEFKRVRPLKPPG